MISLVLMLALAQSSSPPCPAGKTECKPWEREWNSDPIVKPNPFDQFDPKPEQLGPGPHTLIISGSRGMTRMDYKSGKACQRAKNDVLAQVGFRRLPDGTYVYSTVTVFCVPR